MKTRKQKIRLGVFIFFSIVLLFIMIVFFTATRLFKKSDNYFVSYRDISVSGLEVGSPVNYLGIAIGTISDIFIDPRDVNVVIVELAIKPGTPIKKDAYADIVSMGITGLKTIEIRGGTNEAEVLSEGEYIKAGSSAAEEITGRANIIAQKTEKVINNLQLFTTPENLNKFSDAAQNINLLAGQLTTTIRKVDTLITENRTAFSETIASAKLALGNLGESSQTLKRSITHLSSIVESDTLKNIVTNTHYIARQLRETDLKLFISNLSDATEQTRMLLDKLNRNLDYNSNELAESLRLLRITLSNLEQISNKINLDPSILIRGSRETDIPDKRLKNR
jgi:ABC-type transporter Mla subunit MlaD